MSHRMRSNIIYIYIHIYIRVYIYIYIHTVTEKILIVLDNCHLSQKISMEITGGIKLQEAIYLISPLSVIYSLLSVKVSSHLLKSLLPFN